MNKEKFIKSNIGKAFQLRPIPTLVDVEGRIVKMNDYEWQILPQSNKDTIYLKAPSGHAFEIGTDNIVEYRTPNFIFLRTKIHFDKYGAHFEPFRGLSDT